MGKKAEEDMLQRSKKKSRHNKKRNNDSSLEETDGAELRNDDNNEQERKKDVGVVSAKKNHHHHHHQSSGSVKEKNNKKKNREKDDASVGFEKVEKEQVRDRKSVDRDRRVKSLSMSVDEKEIDNGVELELAKDKKKKRKKDKVYKNEGSSLSSEEIIKRNEIGEYIKPKEQGNSETEENIGVDEDATNEKKIDKRKKRDVEGNKMKKHEKHKSKEEMDSSEILSRNESENYIKRKELGSNALEEDFSDPVGVKDEVKEKRKDKKKKQNKKSTSIESLEIKSYDDVVDVEGDVVVDKKKDKKKKKDRDVESLEIRNSAEAVGVEGDVEKDKKSKKDKRGTDVGSPEIKSNDDAMDGDFMKEKKKGKGKKKVKKDADVESPELTSSNDISAKIKKSSTKSEHLVNENGYAEGGSAIKLGYSKEHKHKSGTENIEEPMNIENTVDDKKQTHSKKKRCRGVGDDQQSHKKKKAKLVKDQGENMIDVEETIANSAEETADLSRDSETRERPRRVKFSSTVEVFPLPDDIDTSEDASEENKFVALTEKAKETQKKLEEKLNIAIENYKKDGTLALGLRFSNKEDKMLLDAIEDYIERHDLGDKGQEMVLHCTRHKETRNCWNEIRDAIPWRNRGALNNRAHILLERGDRRGWTPEEKEIIKRFHAKHGPDWRMLADGLGKNRLNVKDVYRRLKVPNKKKGFWTQEEYQTLFELVNLDLRLKAFEEKRTKHGMLRDNISWEAISMKLGTRTVGQCSEKWYKQLVSPMVMEGHWTPTDDYRMVDALLSIDVSCAEDVDWDNLLEHRPGDVCRKRFHQMLKHLGEHRIKSFPDQVELLAQRYCPDLGDIREEFDKRVPVD